MPTGGLELLMVPRVTALIQELEAVTDIPQELIWLNRAATRDATDGDLVGRWKGHVFISDIVMEDSVATIKGGESYTTETNVIPKIKHGMRINEEMINTLLRLENGAGFSLDRLSFRGRIAQNAADILLGIRQRENAILAAMHLDDFDYALGGVVMNNVSWGMPSNLKFDPSIDWTAANAATMRAIDDITAAIQFGKDEYGTSYNRITMSNKVLKNILNSDEFEAKALLYFNFQTFPAGSFPLTQDTASRKRLLTTILNDGDNELVIVIEDSRYKDQRPDGSIQRARYWPENYVLIDNTSSDNNPADYALGKAIVPESVVGSLLPVAGVIGQFGEASRGPVSWTEAPSLNPPNVVTWGADKAWPIRYELEKEIIIKAY